MTALRRRGCNLALLIPVSGPYTSVYAPGSAAVGTGTNLAQGITTDDGYRLLWTIHKQRIGNDGTDRWGQSLLENVYRGADFSIAYRCREYAVNNVQVTLPYGAPLSGNAVLRVALGIPGVCDDTSGFTGVMAMTAIAGTPAATNPATLTASHAIIADGQQYDLLFTSKLREVPILLNLLPIAVSSGISTSPVWFIAS